MNALIVEKMNSYLNQLNNLRTYATNVESGNPISNDNRENIGKTVFSFLAAYDSGISYKDGLKYAAYLISRLNISCEDLPLPQIKNQKNPDARIIIWLI